MLEYPELNTIANQMKEELMGKTVVDGTMVKRNGNMFMGEDAPQKYVLLKGGNIVDIDYFAPDIFIKLDNGYGILFCQSGGKILYYKTTSNMPTSYSHNIRFDFQDGSCLTYTMLLWSLGIYALSCDEWTARKYENSIRQFQPLGDHTFEDYMAFIERNKEHGKLPVKIFISKYVAGIMSTFAAEILLYAKIYPSSQLRKLDTEEHKQIYESMKNVMTSACEKGGKTTEVDLYNNKGRYTAMMERKSIGKGCPVCKNTLEKNSTGGVTAFCPICQSKTK